LAIPVALIDFFPRSSGNIYLLSENGHWEEKSFTAYNSTSKECRIGGLSDFYHRYDVRTGDELVLHVHANGRYEILPERLFQETIAKLELTLDNADSQSEADAAITGLAAATHTKPDDVIKSEYVRLFNQQVVQREVKARSDVRIREQVPPSLRRILVGLYRGRCQVSGFSFLRKTGEPYFEVHHIDPVQGHHPKNVLVVSPNVHAQFTYAAVEQSIDESGWLRQVKFNGESHRVFQIVDQLPSIYRKEVHFI